MLHCREFVVEDDVFYFVFFAVGGYFVQFAAAYVCGFFGFVQFLDKLAVSGYAGGVGQEFQLVKVLFYLSLVLSLADYSYKYSSFFHI